MFAQTRRRPVMTTENAVLIASGTRFMMTSPLRKQPAGGSGVQRSMGENAYMSVCESDMQVSLFASSRRALSLYGAGGSKTGGSSGKNMDIVFSHMYTSCSVPLSVCLSVGVWNPPPPIFSSRPSDRDQIRHSYSDRHGSGCHLNKLPHPTPGGFQRGFRG